jgi:hypothetical protein
MSDLKTTIDKSIKQWTPRGHFTDEAVEDGYRMCIDAAAGNTQIILALQLERIGGPCPIEGCERPYEKIEVDSQYGHFTYYQPSCLCFKKCDVCGRFLVAERLLNIHHCTACHPQGIEGPKKKKGHRKPGFRDGKSKASGEQDEQE